ncbi:MAG: pyridoxal-phosphate dependent enzyme [Arenicellales bacterium]|nr:pyridoxal-phosphate dependent enzyme [Arenicellales bacterium]
MFNGLEQGIIDQPTYDRTVRRFGEMNCRLPKWSELAHPSSIDTGLQQRLEQIDPDSPVTENLFRVHWYNGLDRKQRETVPGHLVLPPTLTGCDATIIVALGYRFPMIRAHKVLAAYGCLAPRLITGQFDIDRQRAVWPSTGNYCRGGVAISKILGCRSTAVLPEGMSRERFEWLEDWVIDKNDIIRTPGSESNVKEIYDTCNELEKDPDNVILNQFSEFGNYIVHRAVTGPALETIFSAVNKDGNLTPRCYVAASGSGGTLAAGDYLKQALGTRTGVVEALECPTLLYNGYGEHNIQGIGDKHVPLIHNVFNTDFVIGIPDAASDGLNLLFNTTGGQSYLTTEKQFDPTLINSLRHLGLSAIANILASIKLAKYLDLGAADAVLTVATDGAELYTTELEKPSTYIQDNRLPISAAAELFGRYLLGTATDHVLELDQRSRERIFNLGYYTWVEQQNISIEAFDSRRNPQFWNHLMDLVPIWDRLVDQFNDATGTSHAD